MMTQDYIPNKEGKLSKRGVLYPQGWENMTKSQKRAFYKMQLECTAKPLTKEEQKEDYTYIFIVFGFLLGLMIVAEYIR